MGAEEECGRLGQSHAHVSLVVGRCEKICCCVPDRVSDKYALCSGNATRAVRIWLSDILCPEVARETGALEGTSGRTTTVVREQRILGAIKWVCPDYGIGTPSCTYHVNK